MLFELLWSKAPGSSSGRSSSTSAARRSSSSAFDEPAACDRSSSAASRSTVFAPSKSPCCARLAGVALGLRRAQDHDLLAHLGVQAGRGRLVGRDQVHVQRDPSLVLLDLLADRHVAQHDLADRGGTERRERRHVQREHDAPGLATVRVAQLRLDAAGHLDARELVQDAEHLHVLRAAHLDAHVLRHQRDQVLELLREDARRVVGRGGEVWMHPHSRSRDTFAPCVRWPVGSWSLGRPHGSSRIRTPSHATSSSVDSSTSTAASPSSRVRPAMLVIGGCACAASVSPDPVIPSSVRGPTTPSSAAEVQADLLSTYGVERAAARARVKGARGHGRHRPVGDRSGAIGAGSA